MGSSKNKSAILKKEKQRWEDLTAGQTSIDMVTERIKAIRSKKGVSQAEMAASMQIDRSNYHRLENRGENLSVAQLQQIATILDVPLINLVSEGIAEIPLAIQQLESLRKDYNQLYDKLLLQKKELEERLEDKQTIIIHYKRSVQTIATFIELLIYRRASTVWVKHADETKSPRVFRMIGPAIDQFPERDQKCMLFNREFTGLELALTALYLDHAERTFFDTVIKLSEVNLLDQESLYIKAFTYIRDTPNVYHESFENIFKSIREEDLNEEQQLGADPPQ